MQLPSVHVNCSTKGALKFIELVVHYGIWSDQQLGAFDKK